MTKNSLKLVVLFCLTGFFAPFNALATHVLGADIGWKALGNDSFEIIARAYRDCNGIPLSGTDLSYFSTSGSCVYSTTLSPSICCATDITPVCSSIQSRCANPSSSFAYGIQQVTITAIVHLPSACCHYTFAWQECCRSGAITTGASGDNFYVEAHINRCIKPADNSPYFTLPPLTLFCTGQCEYYNMGATDVDRDASGKPDSLAYRLGPPLSSSGTSIAYVSPYSYDAPIIYNGTNKNTPFALPSCLGFHLDSTTGELEFKATKADVSVLVVIVDEYCKDSSGKTQLVGEISRDIQISTISCTGNTPPVLGGINGSSNYSIKICAGRQTCFTIKDFEPDAGDTDKMSWNSPGIMAGATFVSNSKNPPTGTFCWTPKKSDVRSYPYTFLATATDKGCPLPGHCSKPYSVYVQAMPPAANYSAKVGKCGYVTFQASAASTSDSIASYLWSGDASTGREPLSIKGQTGSYTYYTKGTYHYSLSVANSNGGCSTVYNDSVQITDSHPDLSQFAHDTSVCPGTSLSISSGYTSFPNKDSALWSTGSIAEQIVEPISKDTSFSLSLKDLTNGCISLDTIKIKALPASVAYTGLGQSVCVGTSVTLGKAADSNATYTWKNSAGAVISYQSQILHVAVKGTSIYYLQAINTTSGCVTNDSTIVTGYAVPVPYISKNKTVCTGSPISLGSAAINGYSYSWSSTPTGLAGAFADTIIIPKTTATYKLTETNGGVCTRSDSVTIALLPLPVADAGISSTICVGAAASIGAATVPGSTYVWTSTPAGFTCASADTTVAPKATTTYKLTETNANLCSNTDSVTVVVNPLPAADAGAGSKICAGASVSIGAAPVSGSTYIWASTPSGFGSNSADPIVTPSATTSYTLTEINSNHCAKSDSVTITVEPLPNPAWLMVYYKNKAIFVSKDSSAAPAANYNWQFGDGDSATGYHAIHAYPSSKTYTASLSILTASGCQNKLDSSFAITLTGVETELGNTFAINAFPNPFGMSTVVQYYLETPSRVTIELMDITGKVFPVAQNQSQDKGQHQCSITAGTYNLHPGIYILKISNEDGYATREMVKM